MRARMSAKTWAGLDDVALSDLEDALSYAVMAARDNYGAGYGTDEDDRELRRQHAEWRRLLTAMGAELARREKRP